MSPEDMLQLATTYWDGNMAQAGALADKKGDAIAGLGFILLSFVFSIIAIMRDSGDVRWFKNKWWAFATAFGLTIVLGLPLHYAGQYISHSTRQDMEKRTTLQPLNGHQPPQSVN